MILIMIRIMMIIIRISIRIRSTLGAGVRPLFPHCSPPPFFQVLIERLKIRTKIR